MLMMMGRRFDLGEFGAYIPFSKVLKTLLLEGFLLKHDVRIFVFGSLTLDSIKVPY